MPNATTSGNTTASTDLPDWEKVLSSAAHLQKILPEAVLVGGTASALYARHRFSRDADHVLPDLRERFDQVLQELESVAGWKTARIQRPVLILGNLDGIETGVRQLIRKQPLETAQIDYHKQKITVPTLQEILRIKAVLILKRNATRDYIDFAALSDHFKKNEFVSALENLDRLYPQENQQSVIQQLQVQLAHPMPYDKEDTDLSEYKNLNSKWQNWHTIEKTCADCANLIFDNLK